jgi:hypothetical protein
MVTIVTENFVSVQLTNHVDWTNSLQAAVLLKKMPREELKAEAG